MSQENVDLVLESIRRFRPSGLDEWADCGTRTLG